MLEPDIVLTEGFIFIVAFDMQTPHIMFNLSPHQVVMNLIVVHLDMIVP